MKAGDQRMKNPFGIINIDDFVTGLFFGIGLSSLVWIASYYLLKRP